MSKDILEPLSYPDISLLPLYLKARPTILIGKDNCVLIVTREKYISNQNNLAASRTFLGWSIHGPTGRVNPFDINLVNCVTDNSDKSTESRGIELENYDTLYELVKSHFQLEAIELEVIGIPE